MSNNGCIVAERRGMMIGARLIGETHIEWCVEYRDTKKVHNIPKNSKSKQVFPNTDEAQVWIAKQK